MSARKELDPNRLDSYEILFSQSEIQRKIAGVARKIAEDYRGKDFIAVGILDGAVFFAVDLLREIGALRDIHNERMRIELLGIASYQGVESTKEPIITKEFKRSIQGQHVLIIEDVLDKGFTLDFVQRKLQGARPASLKTAVFVRKSPDVRQIEVPIDYVGFDDVHGWLTGYGFDIDGNFRELPDVYVKKDTVQRPSLGEVNSGS